MVFTLGTTVGGSDKIADLGNVQREERMRTANLVVLGMPQQSSPLIFDFMGAQGAFRIEGIYSSTTAGAITFINNLIALVNGTQKVIYYSSNFLGNVSAGFYVNSVTVSYQDAEVKSSGSGSNSMVTYQLELVEANTLL